MTLQDKRYPPPLSPARLRALVPCSHGGGCPLGVDVPALANAILAGDPEGAYRIASRRNPFASSCGHGCHAPCETACRRRYFGAPVAIAAMESYASSSATAIRRSVAGRRTEVQDACSVAGAAVPEYAHRDRRPLAGKRVAVVGAGSAGMACAHELTRLGHSCVAYDLAHHPGGLLTHVLPSFRFPRAAARAEVAAIVAQGVEVRSGVRVNGAQGLHSMLALGFDAVFVAIGASVPQGSPLDVDDRHTNVLDAMDFLTSDLVLRGRVVVVGEGDLAADAARVARRRGDSPDGERLTTVSAVFTTSFEGSRIPAATLAAFVRDGVAVYDGWRAEQVHFARHGGEPVSVAVARGDTARKVLTCDHLVLAGRRVPESAPFAGALALDAAGFIAVDPETLQTSMPNVWAGGACAFGHRSIAHAVADGRRAAMQIHASLAGGHLRTVLRSAWVEADEHESGRTARALAASRRHLPLFEPPGADQTACSDSGDSDPMQREASRCFDCATLPFVDDESCTNCGKCIDACPVGAFSFAKEPLLRLLFDEDICNRCGRCVERCPEGAIAMVHAVWEEQIAVAKEAAEGAEDEFAA